MEYYYNRQTGNPITTPAGCATVSDRIKMRKDQKKLARDRYPGSKFEYRDGTLFFAGTQERVPGSIMIQKPKRVQEHRGRM
jgi:hypothetical protein